MMENINKNRSGFTLVEVLVSMAIFGIILAGVVKVYEVSNRSYMVQQDMAAMQQNVRVSKMFLERDIRMAGAGVGEDTSMEDSGLYAIEFDNDYAAGDTGTDQIIVRYLDFDAGSCGGASPCDDLPQLTLVASMPPTSSNADVNEELGNNPYDAWTADCTCGGTTYTQPTPGYKAIICEPDGSPCDIVFVTGAQNTGAGNPDNVQNSPYGGFNNKVLNTYPAGSTINFFNEDSLMTVTYDVVNGILRRNGQPLAEDIEDLQFAFGLDTNGDGTVNQTITGADLTDAQKTQVRWVRINILGRTPSQHRGFTGSRPAVEDHAAAGTTDGYRRKQLTVTVKVRNLGLS